jgi:hypothetical protein
MVDVNKYRNLIKELIILFVTSAIFHTLFKHLFHKNVDVFYLEEFMKSSKDISEDIDINIGYIMQLF